MIQTITTPDTNGLLPVQIDRWPHAYEIISVICAINNQTGADSNVFLRVLQGGSITVMEIIGRTVSTGLSDVITWWQDSPIVSIAAISRSNLPLPRDLIITERDSLQIMCEPADALLAIVNIVWRVRFTGRERDQLKGGGGG